MGNKPAPRRAAGPSWRIPIRAAVLVLIGGAAAWGVTSLVTGRSAGDAVLARVPDLPDFSQKPDAVKRALTQADHELRQVSRSGNSAEIGQAAGRLGDLYYANAYAEQAVQAYELAGQLDAENPRWPYFPAVLRQEKGETVSVTGLLRRTVDLAPDYSPAWLRLADNQFKQGLTDQARDSYERRLALSPGDAHAHLGLARVAFANSDWETAQQHLEKAIQANPLFDPAHRLLAAVHEHFGRTQQAQEALQRADASSRFAPAADPWVDSLLEQSFDVDWLLFQVSRYAYADGGRIAQKLFDRALELAPNDPRLYVMFGQHARDPHAARQAFERAVALDPHNVEAHVMLAEALLMEKQPREAERVLREALARGAKHAGLYKNLGLALAGTGRFPEAIAYVRQALVLQPESIGAHYSLAAILRAAGRKQEAVQQYRKVLQLKPSHAEAAQELAALLKTL